jgi:hypothetical protein
MSSANKHVLMSAMTYNLKKLLKFTRPKQIGLVMKLEVLKNQLLTSLLLHVKDSRCLSE